ncbi:MAG: glycosyltransferase family 2 protein [Candidatus Abyssobacteria bacterium SURF_5]|uniref:Glycosyltransferase family 2 protein n=1 Tax=Abyssobacteria bacterium (strain SURF_5) TaxID=2093360 RepID=A0A3A4NPP2_ABYX5|nr:MAG: glycosyltransferase family 2 protein [Candidatus Abyssubacteria bacterium SURF_5]
MLKSLKMKQSEPCICGTRTKNEFPGKLSVLMPAHDEGAGIYDNLGETFAFLRETSRDFEIIVIDDGSSDNTYEEAARFAADNSRVKLVKNKTNLGKGGALREGFKYSEGDTIVFIDADLDLHPSQLQLFFDHMRGADADVVIGSKRHPQSKLYYPFHRKIVSMVYFFMVKLLFRLPIHDTQTGLKLFKRQVLEKVFPQMLVKKFAFDLELLVLAHRHDFTIVEAPVVVDYRPNIGKKIRRWVRPTDIYTTWWDTMAIFYRLYILRHYDRY